MRIALLLIIALASVGPSRAQEGADRSISDKLPLYEKNRCAIIQSPAEQIFCGDPDLSAASARLNAAIQARLNRIPDQQRAIEENALWIRERNASCGIIGRNAVKFQDIDAVRSCLMAQTRERIAILEDDNFDCLAVDTAAGALICSDPELAAAQGELNRDIMALVGKLKDSEAKLAYAEYARWTRERDRSCDLVGKGNVPLAELASAEPCLAGFIKRKRAEVAAARSDPKRLLGREMRSPAPNADAVDLCVSRIHAANDCGTFLRVSRVFEIDSEFTDQTASVTAEIEMVALAPFTGCSPVASLCTGTCWDPRSGRPGGQAKTRDNFTVTHRITIERAFTFQRAADKSWTCRTDSLQPVDFGLAYSVQ